MGSYNDDPIHFDVRPQRDNGILGGDIDLGLDNINGLGKPGKKNGAKGGNLNLNGPNLRRGLEAEYAGWHLYKDKPLKASDEPWSRVIPSKLPIGDAELADLVRKIRAESQRDSIDVLGKLGTNQRGVVNRLVETMNAQDQYAKWHIACVKREYKQQSQRGFFKPEKRETKHILVILKAEMRANARNGMFPGPQGTGISQDIGVIDLADPPPKPKQKLNDFGNGGVLGGGKNIDFGFGDLGLGPGLGLDNLNGGRPLNGGIKGSKNPGKKNKNIGQQQRGAAFNNGENVLRDEPQVVNVGPYPDPFVGVSLDEQLPPPPPPPMHDLHRQPQQPHQQHFKEPHHQPVQQMHQPHGQPHHQQPMPPPGAIRVDDILRQEPQFPPMHDHQPPHRPMHQGPRPYEDNPFRPYDQFNQPGSFDMPQNFLDNDPRFGGSRRDRSQRPQTPRNRSLSARRRDNDFRPDSRDFLDKIDRWDINDDHSSRDSMRDDIWSAKDSRRSFTPPSSPGRSDYHSGRFSPLHRSRSYKSKRSPSDRDRGYPRDDTFIEPYDSRRSPRRYRHQSPTRYLTESRYSDEYRPRRRPQRALTDYPSGPVIDDYLDRKSTRYREDDIEYEIAAGRGRRPGMRRRRETEYFDDRRGGRRASGIY